MVVVVVVAVIVEVGGGRRGVAPTAGTVLLQQHLYLLSIKIMPEGGCLVYFVTCQNLGLNERYKI